MRAPVPPKPPAGPPPPPPEPHPVLSPQNRQTPVQSPLKLPPAAGPEIVSPAATHKSPTVVLNVNTPPMNNVFVSPSAGAVSPARRSAGQEPSQVQSRQPAGQQGQPYAQSGQPKKPSPTPLPVPQVPDTSRIPFPPFPPFPPGTLYQPPTYPVYVAAPQYMTVIPPPPPPLAEQPGQPFPVSSQAPQIPIQGPPAAPPSFPVGLPHKAAPPCQSQPSTPTTFNTSCSTAQPWMMSRSRRHPPLGRARTISDPRSDHGSSGHSGDTALSGMALPSETSSGNGGSKEREARSKNRSCKEATNMRTRHSVAKRDDQRRAKYSYRQHAEDKYRRRDRHGSARRQRPSRRETSRSHSSDHRRR